jgi:hypothetical protein
MLSVCDELMRVEILFFLSVCEGALLFVVKTQKFSRESESEIERGCLMIFTQKSQSIRLIRSALYNTPINLQLLNRLSDDFAYLV